jgi:hypothetical protein
MISGAHVILYSRTRTPTARSSCLRFPAVDAGRGS